MKDIEQRRWSVIKLYEHGESLRDLLFPFIIHHNLIHHFYFIHSIYFQVISNKLTLNFSHPSCIVLIKNIINPFGLPLLNYVFLSIVMFDITSVYVAYAVTKNPSSIVIKMIK